MSISIYLVENDKAFRHVLIYCLEQEGWKVTTFNRDLVSLMKTADCPDLWILDADSEEGFIVMREVLKSKTHKVPIIMTSQRERIMDRVLGLELGCDDFIVKPYSPKELVLRTKRILERAQEHSDKSHEDKACLNLHSYKIDIRKRYLINSAGETIKLTSKEYDLLLLFANNQGIALSREQIIQLVWGENYFGSDRVVDDLVRRMRRKFDSIDIETIYGYGYRIVE